MPTQPTLLTEPTSERDANASDGAARAAFRERLRQFLQDPASRQIEGFPLGTDEAILALSDPPYYTACPNPFLGEILKSWQEEREQAHSARFSAPKGAKAPTTNGEGYHREPFAADVSEGKNDPIYNAHSYHTKVPHKAIMRYILHYTEPGDIILDGFCGTGMTGVAAQLCGDRRAVQGLGYRVDDDGAIYDDAQGKRAEALTTNQETVRSARFSAPFSRLGARKAVLVDLSPAATFIAYNYNTPVDAGAFRREAQRILEEVEAECGWMYETNHTARSARSGAPRGAEAPTTNEGNGHVRSEGFSPQVKGRINYTVWSDVFRCECGQEIVYWDEAVDQEHGTVRDEFPCPACGAKLAKSPAKGSGTVRLERAWEEVYDRALGRTIRRARQVPVLINYSVGKTRYEKRPDADDLALIQKTKEGDIPYWFPTDRLPDGDKMGDPRNVGITHVHQFYTKRNLWVLAAIWHATQEAGNRQQILCLVGDLLPRASRMHKIATSRLNTNLSKTAGVLSGTLYVPSHSIEYSVLAMLGYRITDVGRYLGIAGNSLPSLVSASSAANITSQGNWADYGFVDPPFGGNLMYSELNFLWEAWLRVYTNNGSEAVVNKIQHKGLFDYQRLMEGCFREFYRVLKPGRWMTVEFHNSQNAVWNAIQEAILRAGFMVADVRTFDKQQGTFNQVTASGSVKQDLIISAYKPNGGLEERFKLEAGTAEGAWDFVRQHLKQLPVVVRKGERLEVVAERQRHLLYDRMVAYHLQRGASVPLGAAEFYRGLEQRFTGREGMYFLPEQVLEYDRARLQGGGMEQLSLFLSDEKSVLQWLRQQLDPALGGKPQTYQDLQPAFLRELHQARHEELPELRALLDQNFLTDELDRWYAPDPNQAMDLEKVRRRGLLHDFAAYIEGRGRLRQFRSEAVRAGFEEAWRQRDYAAILRVAERLPEELLQEDQTLLMYYDNATLRAGG